ncbi:MAG: pilus assembly protein PilP [Thermodesulfovibrio sp.]|jgi:type IV pilus assembly protein PilP|uniref:pilus assembly protein PilP n=1 Tax=Thermodesulfovibrio sp. N1 TaxID=1871110 RepID=UPI00083B99F9|nr:pilus assembly protein PilP [Thermodesulfovibrio sp. N1]MDI6713974.1 pilus assembly protein PilP [Thermodesulfovibrio sp.]ODA44984.1 Type IV pilus biogenesis protein PilP [Thermodesulfovibrio sp. N1]
MERKRILTIILLILLLVLIVYGIFQYTTIVPKPELQKAQPKPATLAIEDKKSDKSSQLASSYDAVTFRDPFTPLIVRKEKGTGISILQNYEIEELRLSGVVKDNGGFKALIKTPDGRHFVVKQNDKIGLHGGRISKINKDSIEIKETAKSYTGEIIQVTKTLKLRTEEGQ